MNNQRRKVIAKSIEKLNRAKQMLEDVKSSEEKAVKAVPLDDDFDSKRDAMEDIVDNLDNVISSIEEAISTLDNTDF